MPAEISAQSIVVAIRNQVSCDLANEVAILHLGNSTYYGLDPVGGRIWHLIQQPCTVTDLRMALLREFEVEPDRCEEDLLELLRHMADEGLIEIRNEPAA